MAPIKPTSSPRVKTPATDLSKFLSDRARNVAMTVAQPIKSSQARE
jgi:hypothetical protein